MGENEVRLVAEHDGYRYLNPSLRHRRTVRFDLPSRGWQIEDTVAASSKETVAFAARFHSPTSIQITRDCGESITASIGSFKLVVEADGQLRADIEESRRAIQYGRTARMYTLSIVCNSPSGLSLRIWPGHDERDGVGSEHQIMPR
ncbi:heparinase II/III-family protein [Acidobacteria bacterium AH-259-A15]|nr:heparinase II/III-family protein [Acidobacteria bacterium AH-259-A15]